MAAVQSDSFTITKILTTQQYSDNKYKHLAIYSYTSGSDGSSALQLQWPNKICYCFDGGGSRPILEMESLWQPRSLQNSDFEVWRNKQNHFVHIVQWIMIWISKLFNGLQMKTFSLKTFLTLGWIPAVSVYLFKSNLTFKLKR